jgi:hypothetical protein
MSIPVRFDGHKLPSFVCALDATAVACSERLQTVVAIIGGLFNRTKCFQSENATGISSETHPLFRHFFSCLFKVSSAIKGFE